MAGELTVVAASPLGLDALLVRSQPARIDAALAGLRRDEQDGAGNKPDGADASGDEHRFHQRFSEGVQTLDVRGCGIFPRIRDRSCVVSRGMKTAIVRGDECEYDDDFQRPRRPFIEMRRAVD